ncbi:hypothetical protein MPNT_50121 [Candidatus Methylacidithermus pantelleriae]|uniref:Uncharacterized protein n=2 Tax=Candidatus Methylacidithermus pantelleriae TaxID=2744239 RepID=A0A8J2BKH4_9BACT|nr:hypothetical protein MPNT_50121 [Candidatus Methylacidithermus pantelleriae]
MAGVSSLFSLTRPGSRVTIEEGALLSAYAVVYGRVERSFSARCGFVSR